jgi:hypothetical protein
MEHAHGCVVEILENRLKIIWCSLCKTKKRTGRLCEHLKGMNISSVNWNCLDEDTNLSKRAKKSPNFQEQTSNLKAHGRSRSEYKSPDKRSNIDLSNLQNNTQPTGDAWLF